MDLKYFIQRSAVLKQYRKLLKAARALERARPHDPSLGRDAARQIKQQFRMFQPEMDRATVAVLLGQGEKTVQLIRNLQREAAQGDSSWKGTVDPDGADERGRVGQTWPWEKK
jgi:hypothetical protein